MVDDEGSPALTLSEALRQYGHLLTIYEKKEIEDYDAIYYAGQKCAKKIKAPTSGPNDGYDNEEGEYNFVSDDHIAYRYQIDCLLGVGAFGQVLRARDHANNTFVAVKLIRNKKKISQQSKEEIRILQHINEKDADDRYGLVRMHEHFVFRGHVCIVYELLGENLYDEMKENDFFPMSLVEVRTVAARLLVSLTFLWRENIIHADLKPENVLRKCSNSSVVKVADLGSACFDGKIQYTYIQSRFYRAPEIILGNTYGRPIDLWSYACILCELATGYPLFPGENERDQLACIMEYLGVPPQEFIDRSRRKQTYFSSTYEPKIEPTSKGRVREPGARKLYKFLGLEEDDAFVSFLEQFLVWDPNDRVPPREAMKHPWIREEFVFDRSQVPPAPPAAEPHTRKMLTGDRPSRPSGPVRTLAKPDATAPASGAAAASSAAPQSSAVPQAGGPLTAKNDGEARRMSDEPEGDNVSNSTTRLKRPSVANNKSRSLQLPVMIPEQASGSPRAAAGALPTLSHVVTSQSSVPAVPVASRRGSGDTASSPSVAAPAPTGRVADIVQRLDRGIAANAASTAGDAKNGPVQVAPAPPRNNLQRASTQPARTGAEPTVRSRSLENNSKPKESNSPGSRVVPAARNGTQAHSGSNNIHRGLTSPNLPTNASAGAGKLSLSRDSNAARRSNSPFYAPSVFNSSSDTPRQVLSNKSSPPPPAKLFAPPALEPKKIVAPRRERRVDLNAGGGTGVLIKELSPATRRRAQARAQRRISDAALAPELTNANSNKLTLPTIR